MKTNKKHFKLFTEEIKRLLKLYGLQSWEVLYCHEFVDMRTIATTSPELASHIVVFTLNTKFVSPDLTDIELRATALHEVLELLFTKLESLCCSCKKDESREEVHTIIQTLINVGS